ncbi:class I SAM-dependent methyltransferase [Sphingobacterium sp. SRCM116780]|uniref:class I SAM-dependent methyltransferase n=1 Tax=Sphingobacterium sp. SRCM116780 TaxID=2907623 RepID=UPI001F27E604|nr:class I SAM-dependent methyltransferase [Sphingobacterium sp. SRCM116780]UIR57664.1 class I SAM-dependent methyltransferase [Sphingobacterium sp. SRCM116780]
MNTRILQQEVQDFINQHLTESSTKIALKKSPFEGVTSSELAAQIDGKQRCLKKLPLWAQTTKIYYPDKLNLEQCSSEKTAQFKASLIQENTMLMDITSGFGVDDFYFSQRAKTVISCEINESLAAISQYNAKQLQANNIEVKALNGFDFLHDNQELKLDYIYIDPSRRVAQKKVFLLSDCEPNIVHLQEEFLERANHVFIKVAPLLDISAALTELKHVKEIYVISIQNDCKELLFIQEKGYVLKPTITAVRIVGDVIQKFPFSQQQETETEISLSTPLHYLYEPDVCLTKAGAFKSIAKAFDLQKLHQHTHLYTSDVYHPNFLGKVYEVSNIIPFSIFKKSKEKIKTNAVAKNFPLKTEEIKKKFKIIDGGELHSFFTTGSTDELIVIHASRK